MADEELRAELEALKEDLARLRADLGGLVEALKEAGAERVEGYRERAAEELRRRREAVEERLGAARERGRQAVEELGEGVGEHPISSLLAAFGVGFILARLLDGGRRS